MSPKVTGQALAFTVLLPVAEVGVDHGLPGQVSLRATLGFWGARLLSSPYRVVAATYWFAAQALTSAYGFQAIVQTMTGNRLPLVPVALGLAAVHAVLALLGFDVMRYVLRVLLPLSLALTGVLLSLYLSAGDPRFSLHRVLRSPVDTPSVRAGMVLAVEFTLGGNRFFGLNGGPQFPFTEAVSFQIACADQAEVDRLWAALADGGSPGRCGWLKDRWGLSW